MIMNDSTDEKQLHSWIPRQPSRHLKHRIFGASAAVNSPMALWRPRFGPALAVALMVTMLVGDRHFIPPHPVNALGGLALSNQMAAFYYMSGDAFNRNSVPANTFRSTKARRSTSSMGSLFFRTNSLMP